MLRAETKFLLHMLGGCAAYPAIVWVVGQSIFEAVSLGVVRSKAATCPLATEMLCFSAHLAVYFFAAIFFAWGAVVAWHDLVTGKRAADPNGRGVSALFRSGWLVRQNWFALPVLAVLLIALAMKELL